MLTREIAQDFWIWKSGVSKNGFDELACKNEHPTNFGYEDIDENDANDNENDEHRQR